MLFLNVLKFDVASIPLPLNIFIAFSVSTFISNTYNLP